MGNFNPYTNNAGNFSTIWGPSPQYAQPGGNPANAYSGQVAGASTTTSSKNTNRTTQNTAPAPQNVSAPANNNNNNNNNNNGSANNGSGLDPEFEKQLNEAYDVSMGAISGLQGNAQSGYEADVTNLNTKIDNSLKDVTTEGENLIGATDKEQASFNQVLRSALSDAIRSFNALNQQARSRFGAGSSAGQAVGELAQQEYFRQQGQVQQKGVEGTAQFADERAKIGQFIVQKKRDLDQYKQEALTTLTKNLKDTLSSIEARKGDIASSKAQAKMSALMEARGKAEAIASADKEFRNNLLIAAINQAQTAAGRAFTPAEIKAYQAEFESVLSDTVGPGPAQGGGVVSAPTTGYNANAKKVDELNAATTIAPKVSAPSRYIA